MDLQKFMQIYIPNWDDRKEREAGVHYISVQMAIMSHLSDAQELIQMGAEERLRANNHINFAKQLLLTYPDTSIEVSENELNEIEAYQCAYCHKSSVGLKGLVRKPRRLSPDKATAEGIEGLYKSIYYRFHKLRLKINSDGKM